MKITEKKTETITIRITKETAEKMGEKFLGEIPLNIAIRQNSDNGTPIVASDPDSKFSEAYRQIAKKIKDELFWKFQNFEWKFV